MLINVMLIKKHVLQHYKLCKNNGCGVAVLCVKTMVCGVAINSDW